MHTDDPASLVFPSCEREGIDRSSTLLSNPIQWRRGFMFPITAEALLYSSEILTASEKTRQNHIRPGSGVVLVSSPPGA
jgi:hypothetical protein